MFFGIETSENQLTVETTVKRVLCLGAFLLLFLLLRLRDSGLGGELGVAPFLFITLCHVKVNAVMATLQLLATIFAYYIIFTFLGGKNTCSYLMNY